MKLIMNKDTIKDIRNTSNIHLEIRNLSLSLHGTKFSRLNCTYIHSHQEDKEQAQ